jgi:hypothetical protein
MGVDARRGAGRRPPPRVRESEFRPLIEGYIRGLSVATWRASRGMPAQARSAAPDPRQRLLPVRPRACRLSGLWSRGFQRPLFDPTLGRPQLPQEPCRIDEDQYRAENPERRRQCRRETERKRSHCAEHPAGHKPERGGSDSFGAHGLTVADGSFRPQWLVRTKTPSANTDQLTFPQPGLRQAKVNSPGG